MHDAAFPAIDPELPGLLARLQAFAAADDAAGTADTLAAIGAERAAQSATLIGALALGGVALASRLVAEAQPAACVATQTAVLLQALDHLLTPTTPTDAAAHELQCAHWLVRHFGLPTAPEAVFDLLRAGFLIDRGPASELPVAIKGAMDHHHWDLALRGLVRQRTELGVKTPRTTFARAAGCLHKLGRYQEAGAWTRQGLGSAASLLAIPPVIEEDELLRRWGRCERPVVSIICTTYNHERYVDNALQGFFSQATDFPFEVLIHDDASTDRTQDIIRRWQARYPRIIRPTLQTVNQLSRGVRPIELLLAQARGEFVATCEGDDYWLHAGKLQAQVDHLRAHPDVSCSVHNYLHFVEGALTAKPWRVPRRDFAITRAELMRVRYLLWVPTLVFRRTFDRLPPERAFAASGDHLLTSWLGTQGRGHYFETKLWAVRRENTFSSWTPLPEAEKERRRALNWAAMIRMHQRLGNTDAVVALREKFDSYAVDPAVKAAMLVAEAPPAVRFPVHAAATPSLQPAEA